MVLMNPTRLLFVIFENRLGCFKVGVGMKRIIPGLTLKTRDAA